jgi:hypothetical protein
VSVFEFIELFYNRVRQHSSLGYLSPSEYEQSILEEAAVAQAEIVRSYAVSSLASVSHTALHILCRGIGDKFREKAQRPLEPSFSRDLRLPI